MSFPLKVRLLQAFFILALLLVWARLFYWQILLGDRLSAEADSEHFYSLEIPARRGEILFSDGTPLVADKDSFLLYANLAKLTVPHEELAKKLAEILGPTIPLVATDGAAILPQDIPKLQKEIQKGLEDTFLSRLSVKGALWVNLAHFLDTKTKDQITTASISGLGFTPEQSRDYPEASMAAHLLGFVGKDKNGDPKGYFGLEGFYERELAGRVGLLRLEKDAFGQPIAIGSEEKIENLDGHDLVTTLDRGVQYLVEKQLEKGISDWGAKGGLAVVMDPQTGAILAMASFPHYDPQSFSYYPASIYKNPVVADLFEPGSIFKPAVMAGALNENIVTPDSLCSRCDGPRDIGGYTIHTFNNQYHPASSMTDILVNSDNIGMVFVGEKLGFDKLYTYLQKFGFNEKTGVDLEEEEGGTLRPKSDYYPIDQATLTFGQGIAVNALQIVRAFAAIANGGYLITPHLIEKIKSGGETISIPHSRGNQIISSETAQTLTEMLVQVADKSPEHFPKDRIPELAPYKIAAKSGTAQIALGGKYKQQGTTASLVGFFPAQKPRFVVLVKLDEPTVRPWGSDTSGPIFFAVARDLLAYYSISP